jgi:hypothetical protein
MLRVWIYLEYEDEWWLLTTSISHSLLWHTRPPQVCLYEQLKLNVQVLTSVVVQIVVIFCAFVPCADLSSDVSEECTASILRVTDWSRWMLKWYSERLGSMNSTIVSSCSNQSSWPWYWSLYPAEQYYLASQIMQVHGPAHKGSGRAVLTLTVQTGRIDFS